MATLDTVANILKAFYRAVGTTSSDAALVENSESANDVAYLCLNHGIETAQRFILSGGGSDWWEKRTTAISWSGSEASDGGRYVALPTDFLRLAGGRDMSPLTTANGERWGTEISADQKNVLGDFFYLRGANLWITRDASPPSTLYLEYIYKHPEFAASTTLDFPAAARPLVVAYAAQHALAEGWFPGDAEREARIVRNVEYWERETRKVARRSRQPRKLTKPRTTGTRYWT